MWKGTAKRAFDPADFQTEAAQQVATTINALGENITGLLKTMEADDDEGVTPTWQDGTALSIEAPLARALMSLWLLTAGIGPRKAVREMTSRLPANEKEERESYELLAEVIGAAAEQARAVSETIRIAKQPQGGVH